MSKIKPEHFVQVWLEACENRDHIAWIAKKLGISEGNVHTLANNLRKNGVDLPPIRRPFVEAVDVSRLNDLIKQQWK